jgi:hypothetical protein
VANDMLLLNPAVECVVTASKPVAIEASSGGYSPSSSNSSLWISLP